MVVPTFDVPANPVPLCAAEFSGMVRLLAVFPSAEQLPTTVSSVCSLGGLVVCRRMLRVAAVVLLILLVRVLGMSEPITDPNDSE